MSIFQARQCLAHSIDQVTLKGKDAGLIRGIKYSHRYRTRSLARSLVKHRLLPVTWYKIILEFQ